MILLLAGLALAGAPDALDGEVVWNVLSEGDTWVGCAALGEDTWCRSRATIAAPPDELHAILADTEGLPRFFTRIDSVEAVAPGVLHIVLDMPFPLAQRDYVAEYTSWSEGEAKVIGWDPVTTPAVPRGKAVRLDRSQGEWRLEPAEGGTVVTYTWNGALGGDMPKWALPRAWRTQGAEVMVWLTDATRP